MSVNSNGQYIVFVGGEPQENGTQHDSLSEAMAAALSMAEEQAEIAGIDIKAIEREYSEITPDTYDGPVTIMLSSGYAEMWSDGEVTQHGTVIYRVEG